MAPSTPPPPASARFAALTIASTSRPVMSPVATSMMYPPYYRPRMRALPLVLLLVACGPSTQPQGGDDSSGAPDAAPGASGPDAAPLENAAVYAHTAGTLFRVDPDTFAVTTIGDFGWPSNVLTD